MEVYIVERTWRATDRQNAFLLATADEVLYGGAAGGGKTDALLILAAIRCRIPGAHVLFLRRAFPDLEMSAIKRSRELFTGVATYDAGRHRWRWPGGAVLQFGYLDQEADVYRYQSAEFDLILFDELTQFTESQYLYLLSRNRSTIPEARPLIRAATNPGGVGHGWVKRRFIDPAPPEQVFTDPATGRTRLFIPAKVEDNPYLMAADPGYLARLDELPEDIRRALKNGDWDVFAGQYFPEFRRDLHVIEPFDIPDHWLRYVSIDWGYADPCAVYWHTVGEDSRVYTYREDYRSGRLASEVAASIMAVGDPIRYAVASPDMWAKRGQKGAMQGESIADEFISAGVPLVKADPSRLIGWQRMREFLGGEGKPHWQIFSTCVNLIRTLPELVHDDRNVEDVSDSCEDHAAESCRYFLMSRPRPSKPAKVELTGDAKRIADHIRSMEKGRRKLKRHQI